MVFGSVSTLMFIAWHFKRASILRKRERNIWVPFLSMRAIRLMVLELASLEKKKKKKKKKERKKERR